MSWSFRLEDQFFPRLDDPSDGLMHGSGHEAGQVTSATSTHGHKVATLTGPEICCRAIAARGPTIDFDMIVLTGTRKQVLAANKANQSRVEAAMMKNPAESIHHINHNTTIYREDPQGRIRGLASHSDPVATMVDAVKVLANKLPVVAKHGASH